MASNAASGTEWVTSYVDRPIDPPQPGLVYAGFWARALAQAIDNLVALVIGALPGLLLLLVSRGAGYALAVLLVGWLLGFFLYQIIAVAYGGGFGMRAEEITVVRAEDRGLPGYRRSLIRFFVRVLLGIISVVAVVENLWMVKDARKQTWHDKIARTVVIERRSL